MQDTSHNVIMPFIHVFAFPIIMTWILQRRCSLKEIPGYWMHAVILCVCNIKSVKVNRLKWELISVCSFECKAKWRVSCHKLCCWGNTHWPFNLSETYKKLKLQCVFSVTKDQMNIAERLLVSSMSLLHNYHPRELLLYFSQNPETTSCFQFAPLLTDDEIN